MDNERTYFNYRGRRIYLSLHQMQQVISGIDTDLNNRELCSLLDMFVGYNDQAEKERAAEQEKLMNEKIEKDIE